MRRLIADSDRTHRTMTSTLASAPDKAQSFSARKRAAILNAAVDLFRKDGFSSTSMDRIAQHAGVSKRTVYNHFPSKEALFFTCAEVLMGHLEAELEVGDDPALPIRERLRGFAVRKLRAILDPETMATFRALIAEVIRDPALGRRLYESGPLAAGSSLAKLLREERARGRLALGDEAEVQLACLQFSELVKGPLLWPCLMGMREPPGAAEVARVVDDTLTMFLARYGASQP